MQFAAVHESAIGTKRTSLFAPHMSAFGVKRTWVPHRKMSAYNPRPTLQRGSLSVGNITAPSAWQQIKACPNCPS
jgi:hypothetical protein